jgi:hypothetical protein
MPSAMDKSEVRITNSQSESVATELFENAQRKISK